MNMKEELWWFWDGLKALFRVSFGLVAILFIVILLVKMML